MRFGSKPDVAKGDEVGLPTPERDGLGAALRSVFGGIDKSMSDELETRLSKIDGKAPGGKRRD